jgi:hypothetical protein
MIVLSHVSHDCVFSWILHFQDKNVRIFGKESLNKLMLYPRSKPFSREIVEIVEFFGQRFYGHFVNGNVPI